MNHPTTMWMMTIAKTIPMSMIEWNQAIILKYNIDVIAKLSWQSHLSPHVLGSTYRAPIRTEGSLAFLPHAL